ncbi:hypothetical protein MaudCBS49596_005419 [Microsporum audouinii]
MAQPKGFGLGPLSRKRKASGSPGPVPIKVANFSNAKLLMDYTEELDEVDQETSIVFNSVGDVGEYDISVLGSAVQDDHGNPAFYLPKIDFDGCFSNLPTKLHPENIPRYRYQIRQLILLMHLWLVQLGDVRLRTLQNIKEAHSFWISRGQNTWEGRTYAYYQDWLPDAIWRLRTNILWICGHGRQGRPPRPGPVKRGEFPLLAEGRRRCKERHDALCHKNDKANDQTPTIETLLKIKDLCRQVMHEFSGDSFASRPKALLANTGEIITNIADGLCTSYPGSVPRSKKTVALKLRIKQLSGAYGSQAQFLMQPQEVSPRYPYVNICGHATEEEDLPLASRVRERKAP